MTVTMLPDGHLLVPTAAVLPNGAHVDGAREVAPEDPDYEMWLPLAAPEGSSMGTAEDEELFRRWARVESA
ncbi:hypothetical protein ACIBHX_46510 [Nonomuraea sp. NPDC050536]|uniref:hypothetical protein n=1 Tax=Nonomuraea sp. NPDC050536 TaxID=3364366 RepID=UPI0037C9C3C2